MKFLYNDQTHALIPARGGSKSIPFKNIAPLNGKPLIFYTIDVSLRCGRIDRTFVSTDSPRIAKISEKFGAEVPFIRPARISGDHATDLQVFIHWLEHLQKHEGSVPSTIVHLRPTSPLRTLKTVERGLRAFGAAPKADSLRAILPPAKHPYKMWTLGRNRLLKPLFKSKEAFNLPRQLLPIVYAQTATLDIIRTKTILQQKSMTGRKILAFMTPPEEAVDIDSMLDLKFAEFLMKQK